MFSYQPMSSMRSLSFRSRLLPCRGMVCQSVRVSRPAVSVDRWPLQVTPNLCGISEHMTGLISTFLGTKPINFSQLCDSANGEEALNMRGERVFQVLSGNTKFSFNDMQALALDTYVLSADVIIPLLDRAYTEFFSFWPSRQDPRVSRALEVLHSWDRRSAANSVAFTYLYFWGKAYEDLYSSESFDRFAQYTRRNINIDSWLVQRPARRALGGSSGANAQTFRNARDSLGSGECHDSQRNLSDGRHWLV